MVVAPVGAHLVVGGAVVVEVVEVVAVAAQRWNHQSDWLVAGGAVARHPWVQPQPGSRQGAGEVAVVVVVVAAVGEPQM